MRVWLDSDRMTSFGLTPTDIANAIKAQNVQAAVGRIGAQPALPDQQFQLTIQTKGRLLDASRSSSNIVVRANPDGSFVRISDVARVELRRESSEQIGRQDGAARGGDRHLPVAGRQRDRQRRGDPRHAGAAQGVVSRKASTTRSPTTRRSSSRRASSEVVHTLFEAFVLVVIVVYPVPRQLPRHPHPADRRAGLADRHLRGDAGARLLRQHGVAARAGARHRHRRRRRDRGGRGGRARAGEGPEHRRRPKRRGAPWARSRRRSSPSRWCCCRCSCRSRFIPGISGELFRQFAVAVSVSMVISAINALTLSPALCAVFLRAEPRAEARAHPLCAGRHRLGARRLCLDRAAAGPPRGLRPRGARRGHGRRRLAVQDHADRLPAVGGPGRDLRRDPAAGGRLRQPHRRRRQAGRGDRRAAPTASPASPRSSATACSTA